MPGKLPRLPPAGEFASALCFVFLVAFGLRLIPGVFWPSIAQEDEIFQSIEQGHRIVFGYGMVPWEFQYGARSWLLGYASAGGIWLSSLFGTGPAYYLPAIAVVAAALAATAVICAFLWAQRLLGASAAILAAIVPAIWIDAIYFGPRMLSEVVAAHFLVIGLYLVAPGYKVQSCSRLVLAGLIFGIAAVVRLQLVPAIAVVWLWGNWREWRARVLPLTVGALIAIGLDGAFDALTWHYPFEPLWKNFFINLILGQSRYFGTEPWWRFFWWMGDYWGGTVAIVLPLAVIGARKSPLVFAVAATILVSHSFIAHKEWRFIYPAVLLCAILAGQGLVQLTRWLIAGAAARQKPRAVIGIYTAVSTAWVLLNYVNFAGSDYQIWWSRDHAHLLASFYVSQLSNVCGIGAYGPSPYSTGGYTYLHQRVPVYAVRMRSDIATVIREAPAYNVLISDSNRLPLRSPTLGELGYRTLKCFGQTCVSHREGECSAMPMQSPGDAPSGLPHPPPYSQDNGIPVPIATEPIPGEF